MWQRIQTLHLLVVIVCSILYATLPLARFTIENEHIAFRLAGYSGFFNQTAFVDKGYGIMLGLLLLAVVALTVYMILQFKRRLFQVKAGKLIILFNIALAVISFFFVDNLSKQLDQAHANYGVAMVFPLLSMILLLMALKAIQRDENMVRAADRFR